MVKKSLGHEHLLLNDVSCASGFEYAVWGVICINVDQDRDKRGGSCEDGSGT